MFATILTKKIYYSEGFLVSTTKKETALLGYIER
jgi:hypothetical protein